MKCYATSFCPITDVPRVERIDIMGYKFDEVIIENGVTTFKEAKAQHRKNLKQMIQLCQDALDNMDNLTPFNIEQSTIR